jgi:hypothetical protein
MKTTQQQRDDLREAYRYQLAQIAFPGCEIEREEIEVQIAVLDDLDELRECLLLERPYVPELLNGKPLGVYARCTAALGEPKETP